VVGAFPESWGDVGEVAGVVVAEGGGIGGVAVSGRMVLEEWDFGVWNKRRQERGLMRGGGRSGLFVGNDRDLPCCCLRPTASLDGVRIRGGLVVSGAIVDPGCQ